MIKIFTIVGARPQFIKAAVLSRLIRSSGWNNFIEESVVHTGQHYDKNMSEVFFKELDIPFPDFNLNVGSGPHGLVTGKMLGDIEALLLDQKPDAVLVYGDTNSTFAGAFAASKIGIPVFHVEAGLRSYNFSMPEEQNRVLTDHLSSLLFCPTDQSIQNLAKEGIFRNVHKVGDVMYDASQYYLTKSTKQFIHKLKNEINMDKFVLATIHRAENTDSVNKLKGILEGLGQISHQVILPLHPRTKAKIQEFGLSISRNIKILPPLSYLEMIDLESTCEFVVTDSGGVQKEAYFFRKPCFTTREETEWTELVSSGWNFLVGSDSIRLIDSVNNFIIPESHPDFYGQGRAGDKILQSILDYFSKEGKS